MKKISLPIFAILCLFFKSNLKAQTIAFFLTPNVACSTGTNVINAAVILQAPAAVSYSWAVIANPNMNPTFTAIPGTSPTNSVINITLSGCGVYTVQCTSYSSGNIPSLTALNTGTLVCPSSETITISNSASNTSICPGTSVTLTASGSAGSYYWPQTSSTANSIVVNPTVSTCYQAYGTQTLGCGASSSTCVNVLPTPSLTISGPTQICSGNSATLQATGASFYSWTNGPNTSSMIITPVANTSYTLAANNGTCAATTTIFPIVVDPSTTVSISASNTVICKGNNAILSASGANSYLWSTASTSHSVQINPQVSTTYSVNGTSGNCSNTASVLINVVPEFTISASASPTIICENGSSLLSASGGNSYTWTSASGTLTGNTLNVSPLLSQTYTLCSVNSIQCTDTVVVQVIVENCTGLNSFAKNESDLFSIHPNPNSGLIKVLLNSGNEKSILEIYNLSGQKILQKELVQNLTEINLNTFASGFYHARLISSKGSQTLKISKE